AGLMLCYMLYKIIGPLQPKNYAGFSFAESDPEDMLSEKYHYSDAVAAPSARHDWDRERAFFQSIKGHSRVAGFRTRVQISHGEFKQAAKEQLVRDGDRLPGAAKEHLCADSMYSRIVSVSPGLGCYEIYGRQV